MLGESIVSMVLQLFGGPQEWLLIIVIIALLIWGPSQIPKLARAFGQARREFEKAQRGEDEEEEEDELYKVARELGIDTKNKSREEIKKEIQEKLKLK